MLIFNELCERKKYNLRYFSVKYVLLEFMHCCVEKKLAKICVCG